MSPGALLFTAFCSLVLAAFFSRRGYKVWLMFTLAAGLTAAIAALHVLAWGVTWEWTSIYLVGGEQLHFRLDAISAFFMMLLCLLGSAGAIYATEYWTDKAHPRSAPAGREWWTSMVLWMGLVLLASNGLHFLIAWELFTVSAYFLITLERHRAEVRRAGWVYLGASHAGTLFLFAFFAILAARTGSWELGPVNQQAALVPLFWLALVGFGVKAGLFPLHIWLPAAHANAPSHVSAILSGVAIKMGIYGLVRFTAWLPLPDGAGWTILALGAVSSVLGVAFALGQHDLKRLLAYHSVENIGIILLGIGFGILAKQLNEPGWGALAFAGGVLHVWNHGIFKALLFLGAGSVLHATGTREMSRLGGLWRLMPWTTSLFGLGAAAICGLPPLNGLISEWLVYLGLFGAVDGRGSGAWVAVPAAIALAVTGALALACFVKVVGIVFLGLPRSESASKAHESGVLMRVPMVVLATVCVCIGLFPVMLSRVLLSVLSEWSPGWDPVVLDAPLWNLGAANVGFLIVAALAAWVLKTRVERNGVRRAGTWDCGYAAPTARMQYTAGSFASIITGWFGWILRPELHVHRAEGVFPSGASHREHTPEVVLEQVVEPAGGWVMRLSSAARRMQHGRLQSYILYLVLGLIAIALMVILGGRL